MFRRMKETVVSAVVLTLIGYIVWPWRGDDTWKWFTSLPESVSGDFGILALAVLRTAAVGFLLPAAGLRVSSLAGGGATFSSRRLGSS